MKYGIRISGSRLIMFMILLSPIFDNINGYMLLNGNTSNVSSLYKTFLLLVCIGQLISIYRISKKELISLLMAGGLILCNLVLALCQSINSMIYDINILIKFATPYVIYAYVKNTKNFDIKFVLNFFRWFYPLSLIIPYIFNIGFVTYTNGLIGNKGFYYAGNEISAVMVIITAISYQCFLERSKLINFLNFIFNVIASFLIGTKTVYLAIVIIIASIFVTNIKQKKQILKAFLVFLMILLLGLVVGYYFSDFFMELIDVWIWKYEAYIKGKYTNEFLSFFLSTRNYKLILAWNLFKQNFNLFYMAIGKGPYLFSVENAMIIEMDFLDLFLWYGFIFAILFLIKIVSYIKKLFPKCTVCQKCCIIVLLLISSLSGHVLFAPSVTLMIALYLLDIKLEKVY